MPALADVVRQHGEKYRARFGASLLPSHARAMSDIASCRSAAMGGHLEQCCSCGGRHLVYHSCRNRACAQCGAERAGQWVSRQRDLLLPVPYFHVVFTLPAELRHIVRAHQKRLIPVLFKAAFQSLSTLCADPRHLGGQIGALAVLHTWTRTLQWHPHVHLLVPGGALAADGSWLPCRRRRKSNEPYLVPEPALSVKFWGRFLHLARRAIPLVSFPELPRKKRWVVHSKPALQGGERVIESLGRYIHRTALSEQSLLACDEQTVTFRYRDSRDGHRKVMALPGQEFLRRYLQHVLPRGVHRVRAFGLLHPSRRTILHRLQLLLGKVAAVEARADLKALAVRRCEHCGAAQWQRGPRLNALDCAEVQSCAVLRSTACSGPSK